MVSRELRRRYQERRERRTHQQPAEELNFHSLLNDTTNPLLGANYGYPTCFSTWDASTLGKTVGMQTSIDASIGNPSDADCLKRTAPKLVFPAHTAPVDIKFKKDGSVAYITYHGSCYVYLFFLSLSCLSASALNQDSSLKYLSGNHLADSIIRDRNPPDGYHRSIQERSASRA